MKNSKTKSELKQMSDQELIVKLDALRRDQFTLRLNAAASHIKDYSQFPRFRKNIARVLTHLRLRGIK